MIVLGIESSCDETSVSIISDGIIKANLISSQDFHSKYGGVVPELSSRAHLQIIVPLLRQALAKASLALKDIDLICATAGPGLIGALLVGLTFAKGLAYALNKPFVPVNHIEGHIYSGFLMKEKPKFPMLTLVVSGGHTLLLHVDSFTKITKLGETADDAAGEAFDKVAKMLGLSYPGGPAIQRLSDKCKNPTIKFPVAEISSNKFDFSFSGLKTSVLRHIQKTKSEFGSMSQDEIENIAASFQLSVVKSLHKSIQRALDQFEFNSISLVGGVAANIAIRQMIIDISSQYKKQVVIPDLEFCGDNAAMIAQRGFQLHNSGKVYSLEFNAYPSLSENYFNSIS